MQPAAISSDAVLDMERFREGDREAFTELYRMIRRETKELPIYALTIAKDGPKLQASADDDVGHLGFQPASPYGMPFRSGENASGTLRLTGQDLDGGILRQSVANHRIVPSSIERVSPAHSILHCAMGGAAIRPSRRFSRPYNGNSV